MKITLPPITPGPWQISSGNGIWPVSGNPRVKVADVVTPSPMNGINWQANARAIAALPQCLEAMAKTVQHRADEHLDNTVEPYASLVTAIIAAGCQIQE